MSGEWRYKKYYAYQKKAGKHGAERGFCPSLIVQVTARIRQINDVLFSLSPSTPATDALQQVQPAINYFEKIKKLYSSSNRHDRKLRYGCYYNLAVLYYYLDDPQAMMKEANGLELNDFDTKDAKGFKETAAWLKRVFEQQ